MLRLALIGVAAGCFSALFGVGGGLLIVPLLLLLGGFVERTATSTSLAAIGLIALAGAIRYGIRGDVHVAPALAVGVPAAFGAVAGATLQQRLANRTISLLFSLLLAGVGVTFLVS